MVSLLFKKKAGAAMVFLGCVIIFFSNVITFTLSNLCWRRHEILVIKTALLGNSFTPTYAKRSFDLIELKEAENNYWPVFAEILTEQTQAIVFKGPKAGPVIKNELGSKI